MRELYVCDSGPTCRPVSRTILCTNCGDEVCADGVCLKSLEGFSHEDSRWDVALAFKR